MNPFNKILFVIVLLSITASTQQTSNLLTENHQKIQQTLSQQLIQFHDDSKQPQQIKIVQKQYAYLPEVINEYSIVHTLIYPKTQEKGKFVSSMAKDSFVAKLGEKAKKDAQQQIKKKEQQAEQLLKKQSVEQDKKIQQQKKVDEKPSEKPKLIQNTNEKKSQSQPHKPQPSTPTQQLSSAKETPKSQQQSVKKQEDIFELNQQKKYPTIQKTDKTIKFKEHQFANPLEITNYPFENVGKEIKENVGEKVEEKKQTKQKQSEKTVVNKKDEKKSKDQEIKVDVEKKSQPKVEVQKKDEVKTQKKPKTQAKPKQNQNLQKQKPIQTQKQPQSPQQPSQPLPSLLIDEQYTRLSKLLSIPRNQLSAHLKYQNHVQEQISDQNWKFLLAKLVIWVTIMISIYQAMCSSEVRLTKAEKEKYAPVDTGLFQSHEGLELAEKENGRR